MVSRKLRVSEASASVRNGKRYSSQFTGPMRDAAARVGAKEGGRQRGREEAKKCATGWSKDGAKEREGRREEQVVEGGTGWQRGDW